MDLISLELGKKHATTQQFCLMCSGKDPVKISGTTINNKGIGQCGETCYGHNDLEKYRGELCFTN